MDTLDLILIACLSVSEILALIPAIKSNSIFTFLVNILLKLAGKNNIKMFVYAIIAIGVGYALNAYMGMLTGVALAMFTLVGFSETIASEDTTELIAAIPDVHVKTSGDDITVPDLNKLLGYYAIGNTIFAPQLASPSLRRMVNIDISPYELSDLPVHPPDPIYKPESVIALDEDEALNAYAQNSSATDAVLRVLIWLTDDNITPMKGDIYTIKATYTITATAEAWSSGALVLGQSLPTGVYTVVGARCVDAAGIAFRFVFIGYTWRPGSICVPSEASIEVPYSRYGDLGAWGSFRHDQVPSIELLRNAAGSTGTVYMDLIKTA